MAEECDFCDTSVVLGEVADELDNARNELSEAQTEIDALKERVQELERRSINAVRELEHG